MSPNDEDDEEEEEEDDDEEEEDDEDEDDENTVADEGENDECKGDKESELLSEGLLKELEKDSEVGVPSRSIPPEGSSCSKKEGCEGDGPDEKEEVLRRMPLKRGGSGERATSTSSSISLISGRGLS